MTLSVSTRGWTPRRPPPASAAPSHQATFGRLFDGRIASHSLRGRIASHIRFEHGGLVSPDLHLTGGLADRSCSFGDLTCSLGGAKTSKDRRTPWHLDHHLLHRVVGLLDGLGDQRGCGRGHRAPQGHPDDRALLSEQRRRHRCQDGPGR